MKESRLVPDMKFARLAADEQIERAIQALEKNGIKTLLAASGQEARQKLWELIPPGAEVFTATSTTLDELGLLPEIDRRYDSVRVKLARMDAKKDRREMVKMGAVPEYIVGSVHAVTETGSVIIGSATGSQLAGYSASAHRVIWIVGAQKIVPTMEDGMKRLYDYCLPLEDARALRVYGVNSGVNKILIINKETTPGRITAIIVKEKLGF
ncbi:MAG: lactate utilization protein [Candidatus Saccharicenans sp.]|nr:lactate utilization protein [Candidatus Saccharicenans sp.]